MVSDSRPDTPVRLVRVEEKATTEELTRQLLAKCTFEGLAGPQRCGVSGGADSIALLWLATQAGLQVEAVYVDHQTRSTTNQEATFVSNIAKRFGASFSTVQVEVNATSDLEQQWRIARHKVLGPHAMLGHTADDQAETLLINLMRGAAVHGLAGIEPGPRHPILALRRFETEAMCAALDIEPFEDPSNSDSRYQRNRVRAELLPLLNEIADRDCVPGLNRTAKHCQSVTEFLTESTIDIDPVDTRTLATLPRALASQVLREWLRDELNHPVSSAELERVLEVVDHKVIACEISGGRRVARTDGMLRVES